jgi:hypothetical protein
MQKSSFSLPPKQPGDIYWVGTAYDLDYTYIALSDGHHLLVVRTDSSCPEDCDVIDTDDTRVLNGNLCEMEKIISVQDQLRFGESSIAALARARTGQWRLDYVRDPAFPIRCETWAPLVDEREIQVTRWMNFHRRRGLWNGKEVDVLMDGCDREGAEAVADVTNAYYRMRNTGHTFEVLGRKSYHTGCVDFPI